jgi:hypothetical protein
MWTTTFRQTREQEIANGSLTFRSVGNLLRKEFQALASQNKPARVTKGAWAATYATDLCEACARPHALANCYYVFPEKAFEGFRKNKKTEEKVRLALGNDADPQAQVRALRGPRSKSKSRTPRPTKEEAVEEVED